MTGPAEFYEGEPLCREVTRRWALRGPLSHAEPLDERFDLANHSPDGFSWGYNGSGPAQLALAILADALRDDSRALDLYQNFKAAVISRFPMQMQFSIRRIEVLQAVVQIEAAARAASNLQARAEIIVELYRADHNRAEAILKANRALREGSPVAAHAARIFLASIQTSG